MVPPFYSDGVPNWARNEIHRWHIIRTQVEVVQEEDGICREEGKTVEGKDQRGGSVRSRCAMFLSR